MADIQLVYFDLRGRGEFIRLVLKAAGVEFEDVRIQLSDWRADQSYKTESPYGQLPYVVYKGKRYGQSIPIAAFFAKQYGFYGKTEEEALRQEEVMHLVEDLRVPNIRQWFFAEGDKKAEEAAKLKTESFPRYLGYLETLLRDNGDSGFFVGDSVTLADMYVSDIVETAVGIDPDALKSFPLLQKLVTNVTTFPPLKAYLASRPTRDV